MDEKIVLYGNGAIADFFMKALEHRNEAGNVIQVVSTFGGQDKFHGHVVNKFKDTEIASDSVIYVAMHPMNAAEVLDDIKKSGLRYVLCDSNYVADYMHGCPIAIKKQIPIKEILSSSERDHQVAVRWLAIEQYYGKNQMGYEIYKKHWRGISSASGDKRLKEFQRLIELTKDGLDPQYPIRVSETMFVIEGAHRLTIGCYRGDETISCDIYKGNGELDKKLYGETAYLTEMALNESAIYTEEEKRIIKETDKKIRRIYCGETTKN